ncbi:MAG: hypothetical protein HQL78_13185 [Magnetococcales bacterium]|nr:hypothetical protein [Magnetococcales bacterium]
MICYPPKSKAKIKTKPRSRNQGNHSMANTVLIGIDPGLSGAIASIAVAEDGSSVVRVTDMPTKQSRTGNKRSIDAWEFEQALYSHCRDKASVAIEHVGGIPGQSAPAAFEFGFGAGIIEGVLSAIGYSRVYVRPQTWRKEMNVIGSGKDAVMHTLQQYAPDAYGAWILRKGHDGRADAIMIACWLAKNNGIQLRNIGSVM